MSTMAKILIVDDRESNLLALKNVLRDMPAEVVQALTGDEALRASLNNDFALAILDVQMPTMDGYELAALLRSDPRTRHVPIIFLTAVYFDDPYIFKGYSSGAVDFITKPFKPEILQSKVRVFLELDARNTKILRQKDSLKVLVEQLEQQIEARKKAEQELLKARMLEAIGTLAGGIAHDFNNMLTAVMGHIELAQLQGNCDDRTCDQLDKALKAILGATELTNKFITFSGGGTPLKQRLSVRQMLSQSVVPALTGSDMEHRFSIQKDVWDIEADIRQMTQVIFVIITNAREAMAHSGTLRIQAVNREKVTMEDNGGHAPAEMPYVKISIIDLGPGIPAENLAKIFDPYFSTKARGSIRGMGLGLSVAHSIIAQHDGFIQVESPPGEGASFHLYLPAVTKPRGGSDGAGLKPAGG